MNLGDLGLHEGLFHALETRGMETLYPFLEKTIQYVNQKRENVSAQVRMGVGREFLYTIPLLQWLLTEGAGERALVVLPTDQDVAAVKSQVMELAEAVGFPVHSVGHDSDPSDSAAPFSLGAAEVLVARQEQGSLDLKGYRFLVVDGAERFVESPYSGHIRRLRTYLLPPRERRTVFFSEKLDVKEQTLALELADAPTELYLEEETERAKHVPQSTWYVATDDKVRLLLGVLASQTNGPVAVFCNLKENVEELARRLAVNEKRVEHILGNLPQPRKESILARAKSGDLDVVALTDEGARGLAPGSFRLVVNYDIPLEGEPYLARIKLLDIAAPGVRVVNFACDRYVYGIPAVEQFMGVSLGATQAVESLYAPIDKSAGMVFGHANGSNGRGGPKGSTAGRYGRDGGRGGRRDRYPGRQDSAPARGDSSGYHHDHGKNRDGDPRNQESIRAGIAELTGVNLGGSGARNQRPEERPPRDRRDSDHGARPENSGQSGRRNRRGRRGASSGATPRGTGTVSNASFADPYAIPMEERMKMYKEKYGKHLTENPPVRSSGRKKGRRRKNGRPGNGPDSNTPKSTEGQNSRPPEPPISYSGEAGAPSKTEGGDHGGFIGRLFGTVRKDQEE